MHYHKSYRMYHPIVEPQKVRGSRPNSIKTLMIRSHGTDQQKPDSIAPPRVMKFANGCGNAVLAWSEKKQIRNCHDEISARSKLSLAGMLSWQWQPRPLEPEIENMRCDQMEERRTNVRKKIGTNWSKHV